MCLLGLFRLPVSEVIARWTEREDRYAVWQGTDSHQVRLSLGHAILFRKWKPKLLHKRESRATAEFSPRRIHISGIGVTNCYIYTREYGARMRSNYNHHKAFDLNFGPPPLRSTQGHATAQRQQQAFLATTRVQSLSV
jgi:hypothetical protein